MVIIGKLPHLESSPFLSTNLLPLQCPPAPQNHIEGQFQALSDGIESRPMSPISGRIIIPACGGGGAGHWVVMFWGAFGGSGLGEKCAHCCWCDGEGGSGGRGGLLAEVLPPPPSKRSRIRERGAEERLPWPHLLQGGNILWYTRGLSPFGLSIRLGQPI